MLNKTYDVVIVGGGNAALCAALAAREHGATVAVLERAPEGERGGNSGFTGGGMRFVYNSQEEIYKLVPDLSAEVLVKGSNDAVHWLRKQGLRFVPAYGLHATKVEGKFKFSTGSTLGAAGEGRGLIDTLYAAAKRAGIDVYYKASVRKLVHDDDGVHGVEVRVDGKTSEMKSAAVVLASGGFEANAEWRTRYLGFGWDLAKVRGTRYNTGDGIRIALDIGAQPFGNWSCAHAAGTDLNTPAYGEISAGDGYGKHNYPYGIMVNADGKRFVDEGADFHIFTYAKYGKMLNPQAEVVDTEDSPIHGLYAAGELVGGIFYFNYPGGSGLVNGTVFGRIAGGNAAKYAQQA